MKRIISFLTLILLFSISYGSEDELEKSGFVLIKPGSFQMGSEDGNSDERPVHMVHISKPFYISDHEVMVGEYRRFDSKAKSKGCQQDNCPVVYVSWDDTQKYIQWLNQKEGRSFRLCTEAEWEYAARAGQRGKWSCGNEESCLKDYAWYGDNSGKNAHPVKSKRPNAWGLFDMHGNVWEWVQDRYAKYPTEMPASGSMIDPKGPAPGYGSGRVARGGGFDYYASFARSAKRSAEESNFRVNILGFRLCHSVVPTNQWVF